jgi:Zn-dependent protease
MLDRVALAAALAVVGYIAGIVAHELTHWAAATGVGAHVEEVHLFPPAPRVVYDAPTATGDKTVLLSTIVLTVPVVIGCVYLAARPGPLRWAWIGFALGYLPASQSSDWQPVIDAVSG